MDFSRKVPLDGEVYALSDKDGYLRAEFVETLGDDGAEERIAWRLYDRFGRWVLLTLEDITKICTLTNNYINKDKDKDKDIDR